MGAAPSAPSPPGNKSRVGILADALVESISQRASEIFVRPDQESRTFPSFRTEEYENARRGTYIADVESTALRFGVMVRVVSHAQQRSWPWPGIPVWLDPEGHVVPVDLTDVFLDALSVGAGIRYPITDYIRSSTVGLGQETSRPGERFGGYEVSHVPLEEAVEGFRRGLMEFLTVRLESDIDESSRSIPRSLGAAAANFNNPYLSFKVHAPSRGIDVEQAPAYFLSWTFFGGPTTPVDGWILPGLYRFRGRDSQGKYRNDPTKYMIPPLRSASTII
jgi:hypothetical protein